MHNQPARCVVCYADMAHPRAFEGLQFFQVCSKECEQVLIDDINRELDVVSNEAKAEAASE